ncbi:PH domain-containing protein [Fodinibius salsisoli]|uniref:PH domain-containing protein n=1 Tax=Fodinibius salsisoli TaxID=2820877 RepID=A0ABT3PIS3_9BACT|nr:PH domain-containing protein [Fodinibius salsisoli]MCW9705821.1 PH domain-containing protein [Fodinibius salsisoli]
MTEKESASKSITLGISWKNHLLGYALSILLIPVFGLGLLGIFWVWKRQNRISYWITDHKITSRDDQYQRNVDLLSIQKVEVQQNWLQKKMDVGDLKLHTAASAMTLYGMEQPYQLKGVLQKAIAAEQKRHQQKEQAQPQEPEYDPGSMEKMDYLTGLWQQGLMSDEDFEEERKHFE